MSAALNLAWAGKALAALGASLGSPVRKSRLKRNSRMDLGVRLPKYLESQ